MYSIATRVIDWVREYKPLTSYAVVFVLGILAHGCAVGLWNHYHPFTPQVITKTLEHTTTVLVPGPITTTTVDKLVYIKDKTEAKALLQENAKLHVKVNELTETLASATSHGGGPVEPTIVTVTQDVPTPVHFKDWRLNFTSDGKVAAYDLTQKFEVISTTGRDKAGKPLALVKLFEVGPGTKKTLIPSETTAVLTDDTLPSWHVSPAIIAGFIAGYDVAGPVHSTAKGGLVGVQWLKRGRTSSAEDSVLALATPVYMISATPQIGVLPFSVNLGHIKHQPLKDLWLSPYVGAGFSSFTTIRTVGVAITATF